MGSKAGVLCPYLQEMATPTPDVELLREYLTEVALVLEKRGKRKRKKKKPGGPRTDVGALKQLQPDTFKVKVKAVIADKDGDIESSARTLGVAKRTLYHYIEDDPALDKGV